METCEFLEFYRCAKKEEKREQHYSQWTALLPFMSMKLLKYMSFEEYEEKITGRNIDMRPDDEIIREIEELHRKEE